MPPPEPEPSATRYLPALTLVLLVILLVGGWLLFPKVQAYMAEQDCIASGRTNCVQLPTESKP
jgi:hypothetical protein